MCTHVLPGIKRVLTSIGVLTWENLRVLTEKEKKLFLSRKQNL